VELIAEVLSHDYFHELDDRTVEFVKQLCCDVKMKTNTKEALEVLFRTCGKQTMLSWSASGRVRGSKNLLEAKRRFLGVSV
jgi:hypothetical protein